MVKLAFPVYKDNRRIGETPEGKISLLAKRQGYFRPDSFIFFQYEILNLIQSLTFRLDRYKPNILYGPKWVGGLGKRPPFGLFDNVHLENDAKRKLVLYYRYAITATTDHNPRDQVYLLSPEDEKTVRTLSSRFILRNSADDFGNLLMYDIGLKMEPLWTSEDDRFWGIPLGERLKDIKGLATDASLKSRYLTVLNLAGKDTTKLEISEQDPYIDEELNRVLDQQDPGGLQDTYARYCKVGSREYKEVDWQIYFEGDFPLYNAMKVNPNDYRHNSVKLIFNELKNINGRVISKAEKRELKNDLKNRYHLEDRDLQTLDTAAILGGAANSKLRMNEEQYEYASFSAGDSDGRSQIELIWLYCQLENYLDANGGKSCLEDKACRKFLLGQINRNLIWVSRDRQRYYSLKRLSEQLWLELDLPKKYKAYTYIDVLWYVPVGTQEEWGFLLEYAEYKGGFRKTLPKQLDVWEPPPQTVVVQDFENMESTAQQLVATGATSSSSVKLANEVYPLGFDKRSIPGLLTS
jgi:hypothetical protein